MEESNKSLALLLVAAIVVSLGGTIVSLNKLGELQLGTATGRAITTGTASVNISATAVVNVTDTSIDFGTGSLNAGFDNCTLSSNVTNGISPANCGTWTWAADKFVIENTGSGVIDVTIKINSTPAQFIGGTNPDVEFACADTQGEGGSETYYNSGAWSFLNTTATNCVTALDSAAANDEAGTYIQVRIGLLASGYKTATITYAASLN